MCGGGGRGETYVYRFVRARARACVYVRENERERERVCVCVCVVCGACACVHAKGYDYVSLLLKFFKVFINFPSQLLVHIAMLMLRRLVGLAALAGLHGFGRNRYVPPLDCVAGICTMMVCGYRIKKYNVGGPNTLIVCTRGRISSKVASSFVLCFTFLFSFGPLDSCT